MLVYSKFIQHHLMKHQTHFSDNLRNKIIRYSLKLFVACIGPFSRKHIYLRENSALIFRNKHTKALYFIELRCGKKHIHGLYLLLCTLIISFGLEILHDKVIVIKLYSCFQDILN